MDDKSQKERLEQELRFLKESFEAEVISKEEFEKGKERIGKKLAELQPAPLQPPEVQKVQTESQEKGKMPAKPEVQEDKSAAAKPELEKTEKIRLNVIQPEEVAHKPLKEGSPEKQEPAKPEKVSKLAVYAAVFIVLVIAAFFSYSYLKSHKGQRQAGTEEAAFAAECSNDTECIQPGKTGICLNPASRGAKCKFSEIPKTNVIVLNSKACFNCGTSRVLGILEQWLGAINASEIDYSTDEGMAMAEKFDARALPMYILDMNAASKPGFRDFSVAFTKKGSNYVMNGDASGAAFYLRRENAANTLDFFFKENDAASIDAEKNLREFLDNFKDVKFQKRLSTDSLAKELGIKAFPAFLVNNIDRFSGVQPADAIKENFCKLNKLPECAKSLSKSLV